MGLEKATKYSLQVATVAASGVGLQSQIVNCSTMEDLPEAPGNVKAVSASNNSAQFKNVNSNLESLFCETGQNFWQNIF